MREFDFGSWVSEEFVGEKIPAFEEFISFCRNAGLYPYIELKEGITEERANMLMRLVKMYGMQRNVSWISFYADSLHYIKNVDYKARLGFLSHHIREKEVSVAESLKTDGNEVFIDADYKSVNQKTVELCLNANIPIEVWTIDTPEEIVALNPYVTGITSDNLIAGQVLCEHYLA